MLLDPKLLQYRISNLYGFLADWEALWAQRQVLVVDFEPWSLEIRQFNVNTT